MKYSLLIICLLFTACSISNNSAYMPNIFAKGKWIDLTHSFSNNTIYWPNNKNMFTLTIDSKGITPLGYYYQSNSISCPEHGGTHLDAPLHFNEHGLDASQIPITSMIGPVCVLDVSKACANNPDYLASVSDMLEWQRKNHSLPKNSIVIIRTGWWNYYSSKTKYLGTDLSGMGAIPYLHFPGISPLLMKWLVSHHVKAVGLDTPSLDYGQSKDFQSHQILLLNNTPGFENLTNIDLLPTKGAYIFALPMKIQGGTGGPLRAIAWIP